ncbi:unnamed protein product [Discula destructiva]
MTESKRKVLITGCSDGSLGAALSTALHHAGLHVYATARDTTKASKQAALGIEVLELDVLSDESIAACAAKIPELDILINNAGGHYAMPVVDLDVTEGKKWFDLNVWSYITVSQAFLPALLKAPNGGIIANQTSAAGFMPVPFQATYNASKAAIAMFSDTMRLELQSFGIKVIDLRTSLVKSNIITGGTDLSKKLPQGSIFEPAREEVESILRATKFAGKGQDQKEWAQDVLKELLKDDPPLVIYTGENAELTPELPAKPGQIDDMLKSFVGLDEVEQLVAKGRQ